MLPQFKFFDSHFHIIDPRFPLVTNQGFLPHQFTIADYRQRLADYSLGGGAVVSGSFQAFDQSYLLAALQQLGPGFVGVTQLPADVTDEQIFALDKAGVRALRFNLKRGGSLGLEQLSAMAVRFYDLVAWPIELYLDSRNLAAIFDEVLKLPAICLDHLGLSQAGQSLVLKLVEKGARVKASGFGRVDFSPERALKNIYAANPNALMFGTDLPSTRAQRPYRDQDALVILETLGDEAAHQVFYQNAVEYYRPWR